jgi:rhodanese-related sulfurtransferase
MLVVGAVCAGREAMIINVSREQVQELMSSGAQLVEVLAAKEYKREHIAGAISLPLGDLNKQSAERLDHDKAVIVYCYDGR